MTTLFLILFVIVAGYLLLSLLADSLGDQLPSACPRCGSRDRDIAAGKPIATYDRWYREAGSRFRCQHCHTYFKHHANGTFAEDRSGS